MIGDPHFTWVEYALRWIEEPKGSLKKKKKSQIRISFGYYTWISIDLLWRIIAILTVTSPIVINVSTRDILAFDTKDYFVLWLAKFK